MMMDLFCPSMKTSSRETEQNDPPLNAVPIRLQVCGNVSRSSMSVAESVQSTRLHG